MQLDVITLFPEWFDWFREQRHVSNAHAQGHELRTLSPREHTPLSGGQVDDTPFGGGAGMVLRVDVMDAALRGFYGVDPVELRTQRRVIALTPGGRQLDDRYVDELAAEPAITLLCGRYEGFDERIVQHFASDTLSVGRYVLSGGELAAMVVADAVLRKLPGSLGHAESAVEESFSPALGGNPEYPHYTRPAEYRGWRVPDVLLSGHHEEIRTWRRARSQERGAGNDIQQADDLRYHGFSRRGAARPGVSLSQTMSSVIETLERAQLRRVPDFQAGDRVRVHFQVIEGTRRRTQVFEGVVIKRQGHGVRETFTVRKQSFGVGVERTFPLHSPKIERIEVAARGDVRRAKLYYLRNRVGKRARVRERRYTGPEQVVEGGLVYQEEEETEAVDASGQTADEVVSAEGGVDLAATEETTDGEEAAADAPVTDESGGEVPEGAAEASAGEAPEPEAEATGEADAGDEAGGADTGAEPEAPGEGEPAPDAEQA